MEPATFRFVEKRLNHCATAVPKYCIYFNTIYFGFYIHRIPTSGAVCTWVCNGLIKRRLCMLNPQQATTILSKAQNCSLTYRVQHPRTETWASSLWQPQSMRSRHYFVHSSWNAMAHGDAQVGKWKGNWWMEWVASTLHTTSEHGVSSIYHRWCADLGCQ